VPIYEFRCSECDTHFEVRRSASESGASPPPCPEGHAHTRRVLSIFATARQGEGRSAPDLPSRAAGGGCGPGCACVANA